MSKKRALLLRIGLRSLPFPKALTSLLVCVLVQSAPGATLTHRYSFDTGAGDSVDGANGILQGAASITNGALVLDGINSSVQLPDDLFTSETSISLELWFSNGALTSPRAQLYTFEGASGTMTYTLDGLGSYVYGSVSNVVRLPSPAVAGTVHLVWAQDAASHTARLYVNGLLGGENTNFTLTPAGVGSTTNDSIGGIGSASNVANFQGSILEFRTYQGALTPLEAAVTDALGPDRAELNPGALQDVRLAVPMPTGPGALFRANVYADFSNVTNVNISTQPDLVLSSDNTNVIRIAPDQRLQTVGLGVAEITASYQGLSNTLAVTVGVPQDVGLIHRYSFSERMGDWIVHDSVGEADGRLVGNPLIIFFMGNGELNMIGWPVVAQGAQGAYVALPGGLISVLSEVSIEAWVAWTGAQGTLTYGDGAWQRILDFGSQSAAGVTGKTYLFLTPATDNVSFTTQSLLHAAITTNYNVYETPRLNWTSILPTNVLSFVAVTYSPVRGVMKMYLNGAPVASGPAVIPLSGIIDTNDWLGRSQFQMDPYFSGRYDEFRIYRGLLSDTDVAADYAAGPNVVGVDYVLHDFASSNLLTITWGPSAANWFLQSSPALGSGSVWSAISTTPAFENGRYRVTVPISTNASYFRLHAP